MVNHRQIMRKNDNILLLQRKGGSWEEMFWTKVHWRKVRVWSGRGFHWLHTWLVVGREGIVLLTGLSKLPWAYASVHETAHFMASRLQFWVIFLTHFYKRFHRLFLFLFFNVEFFPPRASRETKSQRIILWNTQLQWNSIQFLNNSNSVITI